MEERPRSILGGEHVLHVGHSGENREPVGPAGGAVAHPEASRPLQDRAGGAEFAEADHRLGHDETDVLLEPLFQLTVPVLQAILLDRLRVDEDLAVAQLRAEGGYVVREGIEGAAAGEVEFGVVPVTGEDAVAHGAATEREAHVWAAIVDRVYSTLIRHRGVVLAVVIEDGDRPAARRQDDMALRAKLFKAGDANQVGLGRIAGSTRGRHGIPPCFQKLSLLK